MTSRSPVSPRELLGHMGVPGKGGLYLVGALERRVTVYSQQVRALNLIYSLFEEKQLEAGDAVAVIGGGVAGLTAAAAAARKGCKVTVLEKNEDLLHLFAGCTKRWLHPHIYDWPQPGSLRDDADDLEVLTWRAAMAGDVVKQLRGQWEDIRAVHGIEVLRGVTVNPPQVVDGKPPLVTWRPGGNSRRFRVVILALGFGIEKPFPGLSFRSYWHDDALDQSDHGTSKRYLVSGLGDGGLIELVRACIGDFRHDEIVSRFALDVEANPEARKLGERLLSIDAEAMRHEQEHGSESASEHLWDGYTREIDSLAGFVDEALAKSVRRRSVMLNGPGVFPITLQASVLNRLLVARLLHRQHADWWPGTIQEAKPDAKGGWQITLVDRTHECFDEVIVRHGTQPALTSSFPDIDDACRKELKPRNVLDQTRVPAWPSGFFAAVAPPTATTVPDLRDTPGAAYSPSNPAFNVPYPPKAEHLVGRAGVFERVRQQLVDGRPTSIGQTASFQGLGGLGKTQLAVDYAHRYRTAYPSGVLWIEADRDIDTQLIQIADAARWIAPQSEHKDKLAVAFQRLRTFAGGLVIFDDLKSIADIQKYLPERSAGAHVLITSRTEQPGFTPVPLDLLGEDDSLRMLVQEAGRDPGSDAEREAARAIARRLDGLPLAIELAGAFLRYRSALTWQEYQGMLEAGLATAMPSAQFRHVSITGHEADLRATLRVSEQELASAPRLGDILDILTWSGPAAMSTSLLAALLDVDAALLAGDLALGAALRLLVEESEQPGTTSGRRWRIHRLVREIRRGERSLKPDRGRVICQRLGAWFEARRQEFTDLPTFESEIDHLRIWQERATDASPIWPECVRLTWLQGYPPSHHGNYAEAKPWVERALALYSRVNADDVVLEAHLQTDLGACCANTDVYYEALTHYQRALNTRLRAFGEAHPDTARSLNDVGMINRVLGNYERALENVKQALTIQRSILNPEDPDIATSVSGAGTIYAELGDYKQALDCYEQALEIRRKILGDQHLHTAASLSNVGSIYHALGKHKRALEYAQQALAIRRKVLGIEHPSTAISLYNIGAIYNELDDKELSENELGDYRQALEYHEQALTTLTRVLGSEHLDVALVLSSMGAIQDKLGDHAQGLAFKEHSLRIRRKVLGPEHPDTALSLNNIGVSFSYQGKHKEAIEYHQQALAIRGKVLGPEHPDTALSLGNLGSVYLALGEPARALRYFRDALAILRKRLGVHHPNTFSCLSSAANCVANLGVRARRDIHSQIFKWFGESLNTLGKEHPRYASLAQLHRSITPPGYRSTGGADRKPKAKGGKRRRKR